MPSHLDRRIIEDLFDLGEGDPTFLKQLVSLFVSNASSKLAELPALLMASEYQRIAAVAHELKSSSGNVGAVELMRLWAEMEASALGNDGRALGTQIERASLLFRDVERELLELVAQRD